MSQRCVICGKEPRVGNRRSHSMRATKRRFMPNLQRLRIVLAGKVQRALVCTRCIKANKITRTA